RCRPRRPGPPAVRARGPARPRPHRGRAPSGARPRSAVRAGRTTPRGTATGAGTPPPHPDARTPRPGSSYPHPGRIDGMADDVVEGRAFRDEDWYGNDLGSTRYLRCSFTDVDLTESRSRGGLFDDCSFSNC